MSVIHRALTAGGVAGLLVATALTAASPAAAQTASAAAVAQAIKPLAGCRVTEVERVATPGARKCLVPDERGVGAAPVECTIRLYENKPYGSSAWRDGWSLCVRGTGGVPLPADKNDKASSWDTSRSGYFYVNSIGSRPFQYYAAPSNITGNFPFGQIPNDRLSSLTVM